MKRFITPVLFATLAAWGLAAQHAQVSSVVANPSNPAEVWVTNRGNDSVSVVDTALGYTTAEIDVGVWPRTLAISADGSTVFVANQRGNVPVTKHFVTPFDGTEIRGSVSVIDVATKTVTTTLNVVGTEPYGLAVAPNGAYFAVSGFRSGTLKLFSTTAPYAELASLQYERSLNFISPGKTVADVDENRDGIPDLSEPRAFVIQADSSRIFVTHLTSGFVSVVDVTLTGAGIPTDSSLITKVDLNEYPFHPTLNPVPVQTLASQGTPRFLDDIALSPDGSRALVPHVLHNVNHDVGFDFGPGLAGDFANRVYPALTTVDTAANSYGQPGDTSARLHHELSDPLDPAEHVPYGDRGPRVGGGILTLGSLDQPAINSAVEFRITGGQPGDSYVLAFSNVRLNVPTPFGTLLTLATQILVAGPTTNVNVPNDAGLEGRSFYFQAAVFGAGGFKGLTNGLEAYVSASTYTTNDMGYRAGHPGRVLYNAAGDRALLLNRGSEDVFLYSVAGSDMHLLDAFPQRHDHTERTALDTTSPMGDLPLGMALVEDASTSNDDALLHVLNETTRTLSTLRVDFEAGVLFEETPQIDTLVSVFDKMTLSQRRGQELFEDASRAQTSGNFNNSCTSCHFEGGADGNIWQRGVGPRTTMPVYGGPLLTGLLLWKGERINLGETGPMFAGENGGTSVLSNVEQQALVNYHPIIPVPLNPNLDPVTGDYHPLAAEGKDIFHGTNDSGTNPTLRHAGCTTCHPDHDDMTGAVRGYTTDFVSPLLTGGEMLGVVDPACFSLRENIVAENIRNVNSGVNVVDGMGMLILDRNADGFDDVETYTPMNADITFDFQRDDANSYPCPQDPGNPLGPKRTFMRAGELFSVPTKLGVFSTPPYMHDHSIMSLRMIVDPQAQTTDAVHGDPLYPGLNKFINEFHDIRGNETFVPGASKVQLTLQTASSGNTLDGDVERILRYIASL